MNSRGRCVRAVTLPIGIVVADIANSFFNGVIRAIIETASKAGYQILVLTTDDDVERERNAVRLLIEKRVDGLIVVPASPDEADHLLVQSKPEVPIVLLDRAVNSSEIDFVTTDDFEAARAATVTSRASVIPASDFWSPRPTWKPMARPCPGVS